MVGQAVATVRVALGAVDRQVVRRAVGSDAVVPVGAAILARLDEVASDQAVGGQEARTQLVVVHHALPGAVHVFHLEQRTDGRGLRRDPHGARDDVADDPWPNVRTLVAEVLVAVGGLLGPPASDGGAPAGKQDALVVVLYVQVKTWVALAWLRVAHALVVPG